MEHGAVQRSYLGVGVQELNATLARRFGVQPKGGVVVTLIQPQSPAQQANLAVGDVIVSFNGTVVSNPGQLQLAVERCKQGQAQSVVIVRDRSRIELSIAPAQQPVDSVAAAIEPTSSLKPMPPESKLGLRVETLQPEIAEQLGVTDAKGVLISAIAQGSAAQQSGLQPGFVIAEVNRQPVSNLEEFGLAIKDADANEGILMLVKALGGTQFLLLKSTG